jgi:hypothetical protein
LPAVCLVIPTLYRFAVVHDNAARYVCGRDQRRKPL